MTIEKRAINLFRLLFPAEPHRNHKADDCDIVDIVNTLQAERDDMKEMAAKLMEDGTVLRGAEEAAQEIRDLK